jgi:hypothetical protein
MKSERIMIDQQVESLLKEIKSQINALQFGNIDFIIHNGMVIRVDIRNSIKSNINGLTEEQKPMLLKY